MPDEEALTADAFRDVIGHFASGVTVITTIHEGRPFGTTASAFSSLSLEPPMLMVALNQASDTGAAIAASRVFAVNILADDQLDAARRFAGKGDDKFVGVPTVAGESGMPLIAGALATLECQVAEEAVGGTHTVFLAAVVRALARTGAPLAYWRGRFGRLEFPGEESAPDPKAVEDALRELGAIELAAAIRSLGRGDGGVLAALDAQLDELDRVDADPVALAQALSVQRRFLTEVVALSDSEALQRAYDGIELAPLAGGGDATVRLAELASLHRELIAAHREADLEAIAATIDRRTELLADLLRAEPGD